MDQSRDVDETKKDMSIVKSTIPFADPFWYDGSLSSPFYNSSHTAFRGKVRAFIDKEVTPYVGKWEEAYQIPRSLFEKAYEAGLLAARYPTEFGGTPPAGGFDAFHDLILVDEICRCASGGVLWALFFALDVGIPPIINVGSPELKQRVVRDCLTGKKIICLAVTEPWAGSDVAAIRTTAKKEGDFYVVNGIKKFITGGYYADYFTVAVRTGGPGMGGISMLLIPRDTPGFKVRRMKVQGMWSSGTSYLTFEDARVPVKNLIGKENEGFKAIMINFNHERFQFICFSNRFARVCLSDSIAFAKRRRTFGKQLSQHQVIRHKIAEMARRVESTHAWIEQVAYFMNTGAKDRQIAGRLALLKVQATKTMEFCAREASQIFGGAAYQRTGVGAHVERLYREVRFCAIAGGSEEIMLDLAMRQAKL